MFRHLPVKEIISKAETYNGFLKIISNPLAQDFLAKLRNRNISHIEFRHYLEKISLVIAAECGNELSLKSSSVSTPLTKTKANILFEDIIIVPILRAGLGFVNGFQQVFPEARVSHIGVYRNEKTLKPVRYYFKFPKMIDPAKTVAFILDPMLATGGSVIHTIDELLKQKVKKIVVASLLCAPEGLSKLYGKHKVVVYTCSVDKCLNKQGYIVPGLGDAGDRLYGT